MCQYPNKLNFTPLLHQVEIQQECFCNRPCCCEREDGLQSCKTREIMSRGDVPPLAWSVLPEFITQAPANIFASFVTQFNYSCLVSISFVHRQSTVQTKKANLVLKNPSTLLCLSVSRSQIQQQIQIQKGTHIIMLMVCYEGRNLHPYILNFLTFLMKPRRNEPSALKLNIK